MLTTRAIPRILLVGLALLGAGRGSALAEPDVQAFLVAHATDVRRLPTPLDARQQWGLPIATSGGEATWLRYVWRPSGPCPCLAAADLYYELSANGKQRL